MPPPDQRGSDASQSNPESGDIQLDHVTFRYGGGLNPVLDRIDLQVDSGEFVSILGRSGSGKTTVLRLLAGFERVEAGYVRIGGRLVGSSWAHQPPDRRRVGLVFQDYALFPHLTVAGNVGFGVLSGYEDERRRRVDLVLEMAGLRDLEQRYPHELSGGQQQRVAVARALAPQPLVMLMDEPFSNLDRDLRDGLRRDVKDLISESGTTTVLVTHDREEALAVSDRVAVMGNGRIDQIGSPEDVYMNPVSTLVAAMVGQGELLKGNVVNGRVATEAGLLQCLAPKINNGKSRIPLTDGQQVQVLIRSDDLEISNQPTDGTADHLEAHVKYVEFQGERTICGAQLGSGTVVHVRLPYGSSIIRSSTVSLRVKPGRVLTAFPVNDS